MKCLIFLCILQIILSQNMYMLMPVDNPLCAYLSIFNMFASVSDTPLVHPPKEGSEADIKLKELFKTCNVYLY
ncbi:hypothetical protein WA026_005872 [Henosepilachna vigintioctopunctata]|uniref:Uncharacterized protein n=1 Tax=Henosepilachna vigintioctopunctata TaxID=420089 RepID=A0AAW1U3F2_9CUCU